MIFKIPADGYIFVFAYNEKGSLNNMMTQYFEPQNEEFPYVDKIFIGNKVDACNINPKNDQVPEQPQPNVKRHDARITTRVVVTKKEGEESSEDEEDKKKRKAEEKLAKQNEKKGSKKEAKSPEKKKKKKLTPEEKEKQKIKDWKDHFLLFECSALEGNNIKNAWDTLITKILLRKGLIKRIDKKKPKSKCIVF